MVVVLRLGSTCKSKFLRPFQVAHAPQNLNQKKN